jgi:branched-chain amino acid transport system substrate-binding protein
MPAKIYNQIVCFLSGILFLTLWGLTACQSPPPPDPPAAEIRIGLLAPLSGPLAATAGQAMLDSATLAVKAVNEAGGLLVDGRRHPVRLIEADDGGTPETAMQAAQRLINQENVVAIIGPPFSGTALHVAPFVNEARIPLITPTATNPRITPGYAYVFRSTFDDNFQGVALARFIKDEFNANRAAILYDLTNEYSQGLADTFRTAFTQLDGEIVLVETYTADTNEDFTIQLERIAQSGAEILFLPNLTNDVLRQGQQINEMGLDLILIGGDSWNGARLSEHGGFAGSFFSGNFCRDLTNERIRRFVEKYEATYSQTPDGVISLTYDTFGLLFAVIEAENSFAPDNIQNGLYNIVYDGIVGRITFDTDGNPINKNVAIWKIDETTRACYTVVSPGS